jgi:hypothetical protein
MQSNKVNKKSLIAVWWLKVVFVVVIELASSYVFFSAYPVISMLFLGEGGNSFLYSEGNRLLWVALPYFVCATINWVNIEKNKKADNELVSKWRTVQIAFSTLYLVFIVKTYLQTGLTI